VRNLVMINHFINFKPQLPKEWRHKIQRLFLWAISVGPNLKLTTLDALCVLHIRHIFLKCRGCCFWISYGSSSRLDRAEIVELLTCGHLGHCQTRQIPSASNLSKRSSASLARLVLKYGSSATVSMTCPSSQFPKSNTTFIPRFLTALIVSI
jgi:hypothetical protein